MLTERNLPGPAAGGLILQPPVDREKTGKNYLKISCNTRKQHAIIAPLSVQTALLCYILYIINQSVQDLDPVTVVNHFVM